MKQITLLDENFAVYGDPINAYESLAYNDAWSEHGTMELVLSPDEFTNASGAAWLRVDGRVYENDTALSSDKDNTVKINGACLNVLFDRIVAKETERLRGRLEERVRYLVNKYAVTGTQRVTQLTLGADHAYANGIDATIQRGQTLSEFLYSALNLRGFSYNIYQADDGGLVFDITKSADRTSAQTDNVNIIMSTQDAIENASYKKSKRDFFNYAIVCDEDPDAPKTIEIDQTNGKPVRAMYVRGSAPVVSDTDRFILTGTGSSIGVSTGGKTFSTVATGAPSGTAFIRAQYDSDIIVLAGNDATGIAISWSADAVTWNNSHIFDGMTVVDIKYGDGVFIVLGVSGSSPSFTSHILTSYDLVTWTRLDVAGLRSTSRIDFVDGVWVFASTLTGSEDITVMVSRDAQTWTQITITPPTHLVDASYANVIVSDIYYVGGAIGVIGYVRTNLPPNAYKQFNLFSYDAFTTHSVVATLTGTARSAAFLSVGAGVVVDATVNIRYSENSGVTWANTNITSGDYLHVFFDGSMFHAYSVTLKKHAYSTDGITWTEESITTSLATVTSAAYGDSALKRSMYQDGVTALQSAAIVETLDGDINPDLAPVYEMDYNLGDTVDTYDVKRGIIAARRVLSVDFVDTTDEETITPKFGKGLLSLRQLIKNGGK